MHPFATHCAGGSTGRGIVTGRSTSWAKTGRFPPSVTGPVASVTGRLDSLVSLKPAECSKPPMCCIAYVADEATDVLMDQTRTIIPQTCQANCASLELCVSSTPPLFDLSTPLWCLCLERVGGFFRSQQPVTKTACVSPPCHPGHHKA